MMTPRASWEVGAVDLIVCVGDHCHLNGSEIVVRRFQELLTARGLEGEITLKGSFCIGHCSQNDEVAVRIGDEIVHTSYEDAEACFRQEIEPRLAARNTDASTSRPGE